MRGYNSVMGTFERTLRALIAPRRLLPVVVVALTMAATEAVYSRSALAVAIDLLLCATFLLLGPSSWRWWCSARAEAAAANRIWGCSAYLASSAVVVGTLGFLLPQLVGLPWSYMTEVESLGIVFVLYVVGGWGLGRDIELSEGLEAERRRVEELAAEAERAQFLALRSHLDPHFMFNTLNAIAEWCREDPETAEAATLKLASLLRVILSGVREATWPIAQELELIRLLFDLYTVRDPRRFRFSIELPEVLPELNLPPMLLLPLAENAIKHGPSAGHAGRVELHLEERDELVRLELRNPGVFGGKRPGGEGIPTVEKRLALSYGADARLRLETRDDHTLTILEVPKEKILPEASA